MSSSSQAIATKMITSATPPSRSVMAPDPPLSTHSASASTSHTSHTSTENDSGYASTTIGSQESSDGYMEGCLLPRHKLRPQKIIRLKIFDKPISQPLWNRFDDLMELFELPLQKFLSHSNSCPHRLMSIRLKVLGEDEASAKAWIFIQCDSIISDKVKRFFNRRTIRSQYQPNAEDPTEPNFPIFVFQLSPRRIANFHIQIGVPEAHQFERDGCACSIKVIHSSGVAFGTHGGLVKVLRADKEYCIRGMTVGHIFPNPGDDKTGEKANIYGDIEEEDEDEDCWSDSQNSFELDISGRALAEYFEESEWESPDGCNIPHQYSQQMEDVAWSNLGRVVDASKTSNVDGRNFDWALITIDDPSAYSDLVAENPIHELGLAGELKTPLPTSYVGGESRNIMLSGGSSGLVKGTISLSWSYLHLPPGNRMLKTYTMALDPGSSELLPGDCGSWVVDSQTHEVYGYVVATDYLGEAYVIPLNFAFDDMRSQLPAEQILFPTREEITEWLLGIPSEPISSISHGPIIPLFESLANLPSLQLTDRRDEGYYSMSGSQTSSNPSMEILDDDFEDIPLSKLPIGFGFEAGDFILAFHLVTTLSAALRNDIYDSPGHRALITQVCALENSLEEVRRRTLGSDQRWSLAALRQSASQCQRTLLQFWKKIQAKQSSRMTSFNRIDWSLCEESDLEHLAADLLAHSESIQIILAAFQSAPRSQSNSAMIKSSASNKLVLFGKDNNKNSNKSSRAITPARYSSFLHVLWGAMENISRNFPNTLQVLESTASIIQGNIVIFFFVGSISDFASEIPMSIEQERPVRFVDALGRTWLLYLDLINSWAMLDVALRLHFQNCPGEAKVQRKEYILHDSSRTHDIVEFTPWEKYFKPGAHVNMSMVFRLAEYVAPRCPRCCYKNNDEVGGDWCRCDRCGMHYQHIFAAPSLSTQPQTASGLRWGSTDSIVSKSNQIINRDLDESENERKDMVFFQRVRIIMPARDAQKQKGLSAILQKMQEVEDAWPFLTPMVGNPEKQPDFSTMQSKLEKGGYPTPEAFIKDATLIFDHYRNDESEIGTCAKRTEEYIWEIFSDAPEWATQVATLKKKFHRE